MKTEKKCKIGVLLMIIATITFAETNSGSLDKWKADTIKIGTAAELIQFRDITNSGHNFVGQIIILTNDIDLQGNSENQWKPIGSQARQFSGTFDGGGNTISGVYINHPDEYIQARHNVFNDNDNQGFFGQLGVNAVVTNLGISIHIIRGRHAIGGLVGSNRGRIEQSYVVGSISGNIVIGGLAGINYGRIEQSYFIGDVAGNDLIGGLVGINHGRIERSYVVGSVAGNDTVGGLAGQNRGNIENAYSLANVQGSNNVGGLVGSNSVALVGGNIVVIRNSYVVSDVSGQFFVGLLAGNNESGNVIANSFASGNIEADIVFEDGFVGHNAGLIGQSGVRSSEEMMSQSTFNNWNFTEIWGIDYRINNGFPFLRGAGDSEDGYTFIRPSNRPQASSRFGILLQSPVVTDSVIISVITPEEARINSVRIFDALGNLVWENSGVGADLRVCPMLTANISGEHIGLHLQNTVTWDLRNTAGREVASGTYLVVVEAVGISGRRFVYRAVLGVRR